MHSLEGLSKGFAILYASFLNKLLPNCKLAFMKKVFSHDLDANVPRHMLQTVTHRSCVRLTSWSLAWFRVFWSNSTGLLALQMSDTKALSSACQEGQALCWRILQRDVQNTGMQRPDHLAEFRYRSVKLLGLIM